MKFLDGGGRIVELIGGSTSTSRTIDKGYGKVICVLELIVLKEFISESHQVVLVFQIQHFSPPDGSFANRSARN